MSNKFIKDLSERVIATYVETFAGLLIAAWTPAINLGTARAAAVAAIPAALSVVKGIFAKFRGNEEDASLVDPEADYGVDDVE